MYEFQIGRLVGPSKHVIATEYGLHYVREFVMVAKDVVATEEEAIERFCLISGWEKRIVKALKPVLHSETKPCTLIIDADKNFGLRIIEI